MNNTPSTPRRIDSNRRFVLARLEALQEVANTAALLLAMGKLSDHLPALGGGK